ncbi:Glutathione peroxidase [Choanephora cucurbitarum]|uniref:Glutathione peroxidase n=1 Tax=Choanephora cucurbitarum TaxID=101091 RepID=A0A1C7NGI7_9FUNG|nr:Glutathione peroxidase [Choanephora cucurbitarum]
MDTLYDFTVKNIGGEDWDLGELRGKVVLFVNVASKCGYTKQYAGLEELYEKYASRGLVVVGAPCNQFGGQEPGSEEEIQKFCNLKWNVTFPLTAKLKVNGREQAPVYAWLKDTMGVSRIKWNFEKFLIDREGNVRDHYLSKIAPELIVDDIENLL